MKRSAALALVPVILSGCGYALVGRTSTLPEDVRKIYVEALKNTTRRSQLEQILARAIADEFVTRRRFEVVSNRREADGNVKMSPAQGNRQINRTTTEPTIFNKRPRNSTRCESSVPSVSSSSVLFSSASLTTLFSCLRILL